MALFLANIFNKLYGYVIIVGLFMGALVFSYAKGRQDSNNAAARRTLEQDAANRREADAVRSDVERDGNYAERLRRWTRPGS